MQQQDQAQSNEQQGHAPCDERSHSLKQRSRDDRVGSLIELLQELALWPAFALVIILWLFILVFAMRVLKAIGASDTVAIGGGFGLAGIAGYMLQFVFYSLPERLADRRTRNRALRKANVEKAASEFMLASSDAGRARARIQLDQEIMEAGRVGAVSPVSLSDDSIAKIDAAIGAVQAYKTYQAGRAKRVRALIRTTILEIASLIAGVVVRDYDASRVTQ